MSQIESNETFCGKRAAVLLFSHYPSDPRPRRAAETLVQLGMQVEVISLRQKPEEPSREVFNGVNITRLPIQRRRGGKFNYVYQYASFIAACFFIMLGRRLTRRYSIIHVHNMPDVLVFAALIPRLLGAKVLLDLHDPMPELMMTIFGFSRESRAVRLLCWLEKRSMACANVVLTVNLACKKIFSSRSCAAEKVRVIMNAPDETIFPYRPLQEGTAASRDTKRSFVMMYHGSLVERHGLDIAVTALDKIRKSIPNAELRVYGQSTPYLERVLDGVIDSDLRDAIHWFGGKDLNQIAEAIRRCDVGVIPNRRSIFTELNTPTRIFEYLSQGTPVIAPSAPGIQDYFGPQDLVYFELGKAEDLADKMKFVYENPAEVQKIVKRGQEIYLQHKWTSERAEFVKAVEGLLSREVRVETAGLANLENA